MESDSDIFITESDSDEDPILFPCTFPAESPTVFDYQDHLLTSPLIRAILNNDIESTKNQIRSGKNINMPDNHGNTPLHVVMMHDRFEMLNVLLELPDINLNCTNFVGDTPLMLGFKAHGFNESSIMRLLEAGCDINIANNMDEVPLHFAITYSSNVIAHELIKRGADINAQDGNLYTPLLHAIDKNKLETVCMLLYYSADVNIKCIYELTPFMYAVNDINKLDIAHILFNYYNDFSCVASDGYTALLLAANSRSPIAIELAKAGADVNWITPEGNSIILFSLHYDTSSLFEAVWARFDPQNLLYSDIPFLFVFINLCCYSTSHWLQCMYKILESPLIIDLLNHCMDYVKPYQRIGFFKALVHTLYKRKVPLDDRVAIIYHCLSFGAEVFISDINTVNELFGYNEELEIFIQVGSHNKILNKYDDCSFPLPTFILAEEEEYSTELLVKLFKNQFSHYFSAPEIEATQNDIVYALGFFSVPYNVKEEIGNCELLCTGVKSAILEKLKIIPEFPSLIELSRNQVRKNIKQTHKHERLYHFHNAVKNLNIPQKIKNIILFKEPLYK